MRTQCPADLVYPPNATDVYADYLQILTNALAARGLDYQVAASVTNTDVELPVANLGLLGTCSAPLFDARLTDRDVTLKRSDVEVTSVHSNNYLANLPVPTAAGPIVFMRGYNIVDALVNKRSYRFVSTHLEVNENPFATVFQALQADELTQILEGLSITQSDKVLVVVGDFNSDSVDGPLVECLLPPNFDTLGWCPTAHAIMSANDYIDAWTVRNGAPDDGYTCCQDPLLMDDESQLDRRFDYVWIHEPFTGTDGPSFLRGVRATTVGDDLDERTASWLWSSDHAGVAAGMTIRQKK